MKILVFDKYLGYNVGGAQRSFHRLLEAIDQGRHFLLFFGCDVKKSFGAEKHILKDWNVERINIREFPKLPYFEYWFNRRKIKNWIRNQKADLLLTQGMWGAIAARFFSGKTVYFLRDEYCFNKVPVYQKGIKKILKSVYLWLNKPFLKIIFKDNEKAIKKSDLVISNSDFIAGKIKKIFGRETEIVYPIIDVKNLVSSPFQTSLKETSRVQPQEEIVKSNTRSDKFIISIGSEIIKGREIVERIAQIMPEEKFMIVGRQFLEFRQKGNIFYFPWEKDILKIFSSAKLVLIPSIIEEAFGRVAVEAMALGIPVLGSNRGGIPEALDKEFIISDLFNISLWREKILDILGNYQNCAKNLQQKALRFDSAGQIEKFKKIAKDRLSVDL